MSLIVSEEPPEGLAGVVHVRIRLPNGERAARRFSSSQLMEVSLLLLYFHDTHFVLFTEGATCVCWVT